MKAGDHYFFSFIAKNSLQGGVLHLFQVFFSAEIYHHCFATAI